MFMQRRTNPGRWVTLLALALAAFATSAFADPPDRVARLSYLQGDVSFAPAGDNNWNQANLNRPLTTGDKLYTDNGSRAEMELGGAVMRLDEGSSFNFLNLDDNAAQIELTQGTLELRVRRLLSGQTYEVDTPTLAFVVSQPGNYRIDIAPQGDSTQVTVFDGAGDVYGQNNASYSVAAGQSYRFHDSALTDYEVMDLPQPDSFDRWCLARDNRYQNSVSRRYVSEEVVGYSDLDQYGGWSDVPSYGNVWFPTSVAVGWTPYRSGHWAWIDPWGWSWVDNEPWGFAPYHYGRWCYVGDRWGWLPGPIVARPVYAPALVAFVGGGGFSLGISFGGGGPVGWFPLGPGDLYVPWYRTSRNYFTNVNVTNVRNTTIINNTYINNVYNNYSAGRPITNVNYAYRTNVAAVTAVPRNVFVGAQPVAGATVAVNRQALVNAEVVNRIPVTPTAASFVPTAQARVAAPPAGAFNRQVIARAAPPPAPVPVAQRIQAIQRNGGQPLQAAQLRELSTHQPAVMQASAPQRVQVVGRANTPAPQPLPPRATVNRERTGVPAAAVGAAAAVVGGAVIHHEMGRPTRRAPVTAPERNAAASSTGAMTTPRPNALPSAGFAPQHAGERGAVNRNVERATVNHPAQIPQRSERVGPVNAPANAPAYNYKPRPNAVERTAPMERNNERQAPVQRSAPVQNYERSAPVQRNYTQPREERTVPQTQYRSAPQPQYHPAPQPQPQYRAAQPHNVPQPRQEERKPVEKKDDKEHR